MASKSSEKFIRDLFTLAEIEINGSRPWDIQVHNPNFYTRVLSGGSLAFGESYMDAWWDCEVLDKMICRMLHANLTEKLKLSFKLLWHHLRARLINLQKTSRAYDIGKRHYDIGNDLFICMLDKLMNYSCAYWRNANDLDSAQLAKLDLICRKVKLGKGMHVLDIGCGWGSFARYAVENHNVKVTGITVSSEQQKLARQLCNGLDIKIELMDYRDLSQSFDSIVSIGMFEHVGYKNYHTYFKVADSCLKPGGHFLLHTIGNNYSVKSTDPWIDKYIFPNSQLPSAQQITNAYEGIFKLEDWHNIGFNYDKTLMAWHQRFNACWHNLKDKYSERFRRMWNFYLLSSAGSFRSGKNQVWQIVFSKIKSKEPYESVR